VLGADDGYQIRELDGVTQIDVIRTEITTKTLREPIAYDTIRRPNQELAIGTQRLVQEGSYGLRTTVTQVKRGTGHEPVECFSGVELI
jgi:uncharacterized protein YabE (DUF348 family)